MGKPNISIYERSSMRRNSLWDRIKVSYNLIRYGRGKIRVMTCEKCGSIYIQPISERPVEERYIKDSKHIDVVWSEFDQCMKCGAVCEEIQFWNFEGDPLKIDNNLIVKEN